MAGCRGSGERPDVAVGGQGTAQLGDLVVLSGQPGDCSDPELRQFCGLLFGIEQAPVVAAPDNTPVQFRVSYVLAELAEGTPIAQSPAITDTWPAALTTYLGTQVLLASSQVTARHPNHEEAAALALPSDAAVLVREDIYQDRRGNPVDFTRTVWPGDTTRLILGD